MSPSGPPLPALPVEARGRAATASSASTATPPRLFDSDLALENSELDSFGNMFEGIGNSSREPSPGIRTTKKVPRNSSLAVITELILLQDSTASPVTLYPPSSFPDSTQSRSARAPVPKPISTNRYDAIEEAPYSWASHNSKDGLMRSPSPSRTITQGSPPVPSHAPFTINKTRPLHRKPLASDNDGLSKERTNSSSTTEGRNLLQKTNTYQSAKSAASEKYEAQMDSAFLESAGLANQWADSRPAAPRPPPVNKVMTPAQFERYRRQQDEDRRLGASHESDSDDEVNYDDDEEEEKEKEAAKQRRKQEAHLAVYRQQMMKVTGEQSNGRQSSLGQTLDPRASPSPNALDNRLSHLTVGTQQSGRSSSNDEADEDEDVPLGILAAHGFPNKNRPPTQLVQSSSNPNLRSFSQQQQPGVAPSGPEESMKRGSLPVFARHLPTDPYYGASVVSPMHRESMNMGAQAPMPSGASTAHPVHPAGLIGVIAGEEKARAMRRGSPNTQGNYDLPPSMQHPGMPRSQTMGPGGLTPGDHAQLQMSQQMTQMMQMQMQWMQQMQQMMGGQMMPPQGMPSGMPMMPGMPGMPMMPGMSMPQAAPSVSGRPPTIHMNTAPTMTGRTMSTLTPSMANWNAQAQNGNYAASIAPSERSNVGLSARYRPVSTMPEMEQATTRRASTFTSASLRPWSQLDLSAKQPPMGRKSVSPMGRRGVMAGDEEDDDEGWAQLKAKKDKKQKSWKLRKGQNALQELTGNIY